MSVIDIVDSLAHLYLSRISKDRPLIVAIDGLSGSGKTTLVHNLKQKLNEKNINSVIFHIDDYIVENNKRYNTGNEEWYEYYYLQWDIKHLEEHLFKPLQSHLQIDIPIYDKSNDLFTIQKMSVSPNSIILIEGIFLQRREWRGYFDYIMFIQSPREVRLERLLNRDTYMGDHRNTINENTQGVSNLIEYIEITESLTKEVIDFEVKKLYQGVSCII